MLIRVYKGGIVEIMAIGN